VPGRKSVVPIEVIEKRILFQSASKEKEQVVANCDHLELWWLTYAYKSCILICMRTTLNIDDALLERAASLTGIREKTSLVRLGLEALISAESARRLAKLGGSEPELRPVHRRKTKS